MNPSHSSSGSSHTVDVYNNSYTQCEDTEKDRECTSRRKVIVDNDFAFIRTTVGMYDQGQRLLAWNKLCERFDQSQAPLLALAVCKIGLALADTPNRPHVIHHTRIFAKAILVALNTEACLAKRYTNAMRMTSAMFAAMCATKYASELGLGAGMITAMRTQVKKYYKTHKDKLASHIVANIERNVRKTDEHLLI